MSKNEQFISQLNDFLCDLAVFYQKTRNYHWNVRGPLFFELHAKFEELYLVVAEHVDGVAERLLGLGVSPRSTLGDFLKYSTIKEDLERPKAENMVKNLRGDFSVLLEKVARLRSEADEQGDDTTLNLLDDIQDVYAKYDWMFSAFLSE